MAYIYTAYIEEQLIEYINKYTLASDIYETFNNRHLRHQQIKMQFSYLHFKHPKILRNLDKLSLSNFFLRKMLGCLKCKYENCNFIFHTLTSYFT